MKEMDKSAEIDAKKEENGGEEVPVMSKNAMKKLIKKQKWEAEKE
jgi:hypothetical protein